MVNENNPILTGLIIQLKVHLSTLGPVEKKKIIDELILDIKKLP